MGGVAGRDAADAVLGSQFGGAGDEAGGHHRPETALAVPALDGAIGSDQLGLGIGNDQPLIDGADEMR